VTSGKPISLNNWVEYLYNKGDFTLFMTVDEVKAEVQLLNLENIRDFPCSKGKIEDFYSLFNKFGPDAARCIMIPEIFRGELPKPSEFFNVQPKI